MTHIEGVEVRVSYKTTDLINRLVITDNAARQVLKNDRQWFYNWVLEFFLYVQIKRHLERRKWEKLTINPFIALI